MLSFTVNKNECVSRLINVGIQNIHSESGRTILTTNEPLLIKNDDTIVLHRINGDKIIFKDEKNITIINSNTFSISEYEDKKVKVSLCEEVENITLPYVDGEFKALKFTIDNSYVLKNRNITVKNVSTNVNTIPSFKCCPNDYVRYENIFLLRGKTVANNQYTSYYDEYYNTRQTLYFISPINGKVEMDCILPINYNGDDNTTTLYWFFNDEIVKNYILDKYNELTFYCEDRRFFEKDGAVLNLTRNFDNEIDTFIKYEKNDLRLNLNLDELFNVNLLKNDYYKQFYANEEKVKNINSIIDNEKQIFEPKLIKIADSTKELMDSIVNEIVIKPVFLKRAIEDEVSELEENEEFKWSNGEKTREYYNTREDKNDCMSLYDLGFTEADIKYQKNCLKKSFLRLSFYDSKNRANQNLLYYSTIFYNTNAIYSEYLENSKDKNTPQFISNIFNIRSRYDYTNSSEGYYLYLYPSLCKGEVGTTIYLKVEFNHAKYGKTIQLLHPSDDEYRYGFVSTRGSYSKGVEKYFEELYIPIKISYKKDINKYIWYIDKDGVNDVNNYKIVLKLYEPIINKEN